MDKFDPLDFGFVKLSLQHGSLCFYEYRSGDFCDGKMNSHRINVYLTQDGDFVTVWHGIFDPAFIDQKYFDLLERFGLGDFDFSENYDTPLLRAYIEDKDQAEVILASLRFERLPPSIIHIDEERGIVCDRLPGYHDEPEEIQNKRRALLEESVRQSAEDESLSSEAVHKWLMDPDAEAFPKA